MANAQSLSDEEFHRMQLQLIEIRTESYTLRDENKKLTLKLKDISAREARLDKELNKQVKLKKALSTLNKSKQAQEYEALLQQTEQEFNLQSQTLMQELTRLTDTVDKVEKENRALKQQPGTSSTDSNTEAELRRLRAENTVLKTNIENLNLKHKEELQQLSEARQQLKEKQQKSLSPVDSASASAHHESGTTNGAALDDEQSSKGDAITETDAVESGIDREAARSVAESNHTDFRSVVSDERLLHAEAQCERLKQQLQELNDIRVMYETEKEEKLLLQKALEDEGTRRVSECRALTDEVESFRDKLDRKQASYLQLQEEKETIYGQLQETKDALTAHRKASANQLEADKDKLQSEIVSLGKALQNAQDLLEKQQSSMANLQTQAKAHETEKTHLVEEKVEVQKSLEEAHQKLSALDQRHFEQSTQSGKIQSQLASLEARLEKAVMERDDAVTKFEENARASGALLQRVDTVERDNEVLRHELEAAKELAEKRKKVMDKQAVESQEHNAKYTERVMSMQNDYDATIKQTTERYEEKLKTLEQTNKRQEQELVRMNHQDRAKTREIDTIQQQLRDVQSSVSSLENSRGWFERALKDAEGVAENKEADHAREIEELKASHDKNLEVVRSQVRAKDDEMAEVDSRFDALNEELTARDSMIDQLKQDIQDEISKQKLVEKKSHTTMKDLKRQLVLEKKRNEKLQEKMKEISSSNSNLDELLLVVDGAEKSGTTGGDGSSVSSFSLRDLISSNKSTDAPSQTGTSSHSSTPVATVSVSKAESRDLLSRIKTLQEDKWQLEDRVRHLEEGAGAMADELVEKRKLLQQYVHHTRTDVHRAKASNEELASSRSLGNRVRSIITGQEEADVANVRELNKKLTRMLEEEMTKNMALKEDLAKLSSELAAK